MALDIKTNNYTFLVVTKSKLNSNTIYWDSNTCSRFIMDKTGKIYKCWTHNTANNYIKYTRRYDGINWFRKWLIDIYKLIWKDKLLYIGKEWDGIRYW